MGRYLVSFTTDTPISIHDYRFAESSKQPKIFRNEFQYPDHLIVVETFDNVAQNESTTSRKGLRIDVALDSTDISSSIDKAGGYADAVVSFLVLCTSCYAHVVKFDFVYEITPGIDKREYLRDFYLEEVQSLIRREAEPDIFGPIFNAASQHEDKMAQGHSKSEWHRQSGLQRAVKWFREGIATDISEDEFIYYWLALEALDDLLPQEETQFPRKKCAECGQDIDICPYCKGDPKAYATTSPLYGIKQLAHDAGLSKNEFRDLVKVRAKIFHASAALRATRKPEDEPLIESIRTRLPLVRNLVIDGLGKVLGLPAEATQRIKEHQPLKERQAVRLRLKAYLEDFDVGRTSEEGCPIHPIIEVTTGKLEIISVPSGKYTVKGKRGFKPINCKWAANKEREAELWGDVTSVMQGEISGKLSNDDA